MKILFVTRKFPPSVGGMQRLSYHLIAEMRERVEVRAITWGRSQKLLPIFFPYALVKSIWLGFAGIDLVHIGDAVTAPIGYVMKTLFHIPAVVYVHGLDITFRSRLYQMLIPRFLPSFDVIICNSRATRKICIERGIPPRKCRVITPGVAVPTELQPRGACREWLEQQLGLDLADTWILLTVGRLVPRKGVAWFAQSVLPQLAATGLNARYVVVGSGPEEKRLRSLAASSEIGARLHVLGHVAEKDLARVYRAADLFIMPNLPTPGDVEGFGIVAIEASANGLPVLAADLEGITDAVIPDRTGFLVQSGDAESWARVVSDLLSNPGQLDELRELAYSTVKERFSWSRMADEHEQVFNELLGAQT